MGTQGTCPQVSTIACNCRHVATKVPFAIAARRPQMSKDPAVLKRLRVVNSLRVRSDSLS